MREAVFGNTKHERPGAGPALRAVFAALHTGNRRLFPLLWRATSSRSDRGPSTRLAQTAQADLPGSTKRMQPHVSLKTREPIRARNSNPSPLGKKTKKTKVVTL